MKLLYITNQICGSGGLERVLAIKTKYLIDNFDYEVHIVTLNQDEKQLFFDFSSKITMHNIFVKGNFIQYLKSYIIGLRRLANIIKPDIILVCDDGLKGFFIPTILAGTLPIIYERHVSRNIMLNENDSFFSIIKTKFYFLLMICLAKTFNKFVVLTNDNIAEWNTNNIEVIPNPLSFYPKQVAALENKIVIAVGKQSYQKGYDRLLKSWQIVNKVNPDWQLCIYGKLDESQGLELLAKKLNIQQSIRFFDAEKNIENCFLESSIFVLSSRYEGFGMVIIEAMACGLPVVSFDCPCGPKDIIDNEINGYLIQNNDIEQFANTINKLIDSKDLRHKLGENARTNAQRFMPEIVVSKWNNLFKSIVQD